MCGAIHIAKTWGRSAGTSRLYAGATAAVRVAIITGSAHDWIDRSDCQRDPLPDNFTSVDLRKHPRIASGYPDESGECNVILVGDECVLNLRMGMTIWAAQCCDNWHWICAGPGITARMNCGNDSIPRSGNKLGTPGWSSEPRRRNEWRRRSPTQNFVTFCNNSGVQ